MGPRVSVCRKGENIFLTIKGEINWESSGELLSVLRQMLMTSMKCVAPGTQVTYCLKARGTVDLEKIAHFQQAIADQPCGTEVCEDAPAGPEHESGFLQKESLKSKPRNGLILVKGGAF